MDSATEDILFQKIEELVLDEDHIVTYSVLCENLNICVSEAKLILEKYVSDQNPGNISVTYLVCGKLKTGEYGIQIVESTLLNEKKKLFDNIKNEIVYSIQKSNNIDFNLIAAIEYESKNRIKGSIVSEKCRERTLKTTILPPLPPQKNFEKQKPSSFFKVVPKPKSTEDEEKIKTEPMSVKTNAQSQKLTSKNTKMPGSLSSFLSQPNEKQIKDSNSEDKAKISSVDKDDVKATSIKIEESNKADVENATEKEKENLNSNKKRDVLQQQGKEKSVKQEISNKLPKKEKKDDTKKRKRIIMDSDSDDDLFGNNEDERMVLEESDDEQAKPIVKPISVPKNKRRKAVEKTYEDEEGFIVTKTEYVLVSASEDEEPEVEKKIEIPKIKQTERKEEKISVPKAVSKKKGKALAANQSSITNFFKRK